MMGDFLTTEEFGRYVIQHDNRQDRFFREHNGALAEIKRGLADQNKLLREQNSQFATLLNESEDKRTAWCDQHEKEHEEIKKTIWSRGKVIAWWITSIVITAALGALGIILTHLLTHTVK
jgi:hypothetical protein